METTDAGDEATLTASFGGVEQAERAAQALRAAGFDIVQVSEGAFAAEAPMGEPWAEWGWPGYQTGAGGDHPLGMARNDGPLLRAVIPVTDRPRVVHIIEAAGGRL